MWLEGGVMGVVRREGGVVGVVRMKVPQIR